MFYKLYHKHRWFLCKSYEKIETESSSNAVYIFQDIVEVECFPSDSDIPMIMKYSKLEQYHTIIAPKTTTVSIEEAWCIPPKRIGVIGRPIFFSSIFDDEQRNAHYRAFVDPYIDNVPVQIFPDPFMGTGKEVDYQADLEKMRGYFTGANLWRHGEMFFEQNAEEIAARFAKLIPRPAVHIDNEEVTRVCQTILPTDASVIANKLKEVTDEINLLIKSKKDDRVRAEIKRLRDVQSRLKSWQT